MRPTEVNDSEIIEAGTALMAEGRSVTGFALRKKTGGGNPSRLRQVWDEHVAANALPSEPIAELPIELAELMTRVSADLTAQLARLAAELNDKANKAAERRVAEVVRSASDQRQQTERELADAAVTVDELEIKLSEANAATERQTAALNELASKMQAQAVDLARVTEQLASERQRAERLSTELSEAKQSSADAAALQERLQRFLDQSEAAMADIPSPKKR